MSYIIGLERWRRQPQYLAELDPRWITPGAVQCSLIDPGLGAFDDRFSSGTWTTSGTPTIVGTRYGRAFSFGSGNLFSRTAVSATPDDTGTQAARSETHVLAFTFTSNAAQETVFSIGSAYNDASPHVLLQNNSGTLRVYSLTYGTGGPYKDIATVELNKLYVFAFVYGPEANPSYPRYYYLNGRLVWDATAAYSNISPAQNKFPILGAGYPGYCSNGRILGYYVERGVGCAWHSSKVADLGENFWALYRPRKLQIYVPAAAAAETRYGRPTSDIQAQWTPSAGADNFATIDEASASDTDYVLTAGAAVDVYKCTSMSFASMTTPQIALRVPSGFTPNGAITLGLYEGSPLVSGTLIAELSIPSPTAGTDYSYSLTGGETTALGAADGANLYWRLEGAAS